MCPSHNLDTEEIDRFWVNAARELGFAVVRTDTCYASTDGAGTIEIGVRDTLDDEDALAQLLFHELSHAIVQGEENLHRRDWGMDNTTNDDIDREYACLRVQAHLADRFTLRSIMTPTTEVRDYYRALESDPMAGHDRACDLARVAIESELFARWRPVLDRALALTARALARAGAATGDRDTLCASGIDPGNQQRAPGARDG